jgi:hypothetical protein
LIQIIVELFHPDNLHARKLAQNNQRSNGYLFGYYQSPNRTRGSSPKGLLLGGGSYRLLPCLKPRRDLSAFIAADATGLLCVWRSG